MHFCRFLPPNLAEGKPYVGELLLEGFVHVFLEVRGFDVFNDRSLKRKTRGGVTMTTRSALGRVTGSSHTSVGFHGLTIRAGVTRVTLKIRLLILYIFLHKSSKKTRANNEPIPLTHIPLCESKA